MRLPKCGGWEEEIPHCVRNDGAKRNGGNGAKRDGRNSREQQRGAGGEVSNKTGDVSIKLKSGTLYY
jgi:hypothetical protein